MIDFLSRLPSRVGFLALSTAAALCAGMAALCFAHDAPVLAAVNVLCFAYFTVSALEVFPS